MIAKLWRQVHGGLHAVQDAEQWRVEYKHWAKHEASFSLKDELCSWRYEFLPKMIRIYDFASFSREDFLSDRRQHLYTTRINGDSGAVLADKLLYHRVMYAWKPYLPHLHGLYTNGQFRPEQQQGPVAVDDYVAALLQDETFRGLILKPYRGASGKGILLLQRRDDGCLEYKGKPLPAEALAAFFRERLRGTYIVEGIVGQASYARCIFPDSANTMRILVMRDPADGKFFIAWAVHRFGNSQTAPVDNFSAGGFSVLVDLATGRMGKATRVEEHGLSWHSHHTETGVRIEGETIPKWQQICAMVLRISEDLPFLNYIGWDVLVKDEEPGICFIEGNDGSGVKALQVHGPLLAEPRIRRFYEHYGVV